MPTQVGFVSVGGWFDPPPSLREGLGEGGDVRTTESQRSRIIRTRTARGWRPVGHCLSAIPTTLPLLARAGFLRGQGWRWLRWVGKVSGQSAGTRTVAIGSDRKPRAPRRWPRAGPCPSAAVDEHFSDSRTPPTPPCQGGASEAAVLASGVITHVNQAWPRSMQSPPPAPPLGKGGLGGCVVRPTSQFNRDKRSWRPPMGSNGCSR